MSFPRALSNSRRSSELLGASMLFPPVLCDGKSISLCGSFERKLIEKIANRIKMLKTKYGIEIIFAWTCLRKWKKFGTFFKKNI